MFDLDLKKRRFTAGNCWGWMMATTSFISSLLNLLGGEDLETAVALQSVFFDVQTAQLGFF